MVAFMEQMVALAEQGKKDFKKQKFKYIQEIARLLLLQAPP